jgi:hypothetical protein
MARDIGGRGQDPNTVERRDVSADGITELESTLFHEDHHGDGCHRLRHRSDPEDRGRPHWTPRLEIGIPGRIERDDLSAARDECDNSSDIVSFDEPVHRGVESRQAR